MTTLRILFLGLNVVALAAVVFLFFRLRKAERKRLRVEAPNSRYRSPYVEDIEAKERWESLSLENMHEVNRDEVKKVLSKLKATSVRALTDGERAFLDRMVEAERRTLRVRAAASPTSSTPSESPA